jgi:HAD superfamily hydrolase (TIGR01509 family)
VTPQALVLDLDGTVVDSHAYTFAAFRAALAPCGIVPSDAEVHERFGPPERVILAGFVGATAVDAAYARLQDYYRSHATGLRAEPRLVALLHDARRAGIACGLFTGRAGDSTALVLGGIGLSHAFDSRVVGDDAVRPKPAPDGVLVLAERFRCAPASVLVIGDSPLDVEAAHRAGAAAVLATWFPLPQRTVPAGVEAVDDPDRLRARLGLPAVTGPGS